MTQVWIAAALLLTAQFEVATVKPTPPDWNGGRWIRMQSTHQFVARNHALRTLISAAYYLSPKAISGGPDWVDSQHFDILAKAPGETRPTLDEQMAMLQTLLAERFQLSFHRETKEMPIFALTIAKGGLKMKESTPPAEAKPEGPTPPAFVIYPHEVKMPGRGVTIAELVDVMQRAAMDRPVIDMTGLTARYDFDLEFVPDETLFGGALGKGTDDSGKPGLFAAMQEQLGLKLEATKGPVSTIVIDKATRPTAN
jgi:uncharacterized protein (TIGR03435 family)